MPFDVLQNWWHFESSGTEHAPRIKQGPGFFTTSFATGNKTRLEISSNILEKYLAFQTSYIIFHKKHSSYNLKIKEICIFDQKKKKYAFKTRLSYYTM